MNYRNAAIAASVGLLVGAAGTLSAESIGINFTGTGGGENAVLTPDQVCGYTSVEQSNWNNTGLGNGTLPASTIQNEAGNPMPDFTLSYSSSNNGWNTGDGGDDNSDMFDGYFESGQDAPLFVNFESIPYSQYDLYVYMTRDGVDEAAGGLTVDGGASVIWYRPSWVEGDPPELGWVGSWTQATSTDLLSPTPLANYAKFTGLTSSDLTLGGVTVGGAKGAAICGLQIVNTGTVIAPSGVTIGDPSVGVTETGPVDYPVTYVFADTVNLTAADVSLLPSEGSVSGTVTILDGTTATPTIRIENITGVGTLSILLAPGTSSNANGGDSGAGPTAEVLIGARPSGPATPTAGSVLWWDGSDIDGSGNSTLTDGQTVTTWMDKSGNGNNGTAATGGTFIAENAGFDNKGTIEFHGNRNEEAYYFATQIPNTRTVFWAISKADNGVNYMMGANSWGGGYGWHGGDGPIWASWTQEVITNGVTRVAGVPVDGLTYNIYPDGPTAVSLVATGDCVADFFSGDGRGYNDRAWYGDLAELIMYDRALTDQEVSDTEDYLASKYYFIRSLFADNPIVNMTEPANGDQVIIDKAIDLMATAEALGGADIDHVEFYVNWEFVGSDATPDGDGNYSVSWTATTEGEFSVFARAVDTAIPSRAANSDPIDISAANAIYVAADGTGGGGSFADAASLDTALGIVNGAGGAAGPIYMKAGTYSLSTTVTVLAPARILGGFAGTEASPEDRTGEPGVDNVTTLDGQGAVQVLITGSDIELDRISFINGVAEQGGGLRVAGSTLLMTDCMVTDCEATDSGGGLYIAGNVEPLITGSTFANNTAVNRGGGIKVAGNPGPEIRNSLFSGNSATLGGGIDYDTTSPYGCIHCTFVGNTASDRGGAMYQSGNGTSAAFQTVFDSNTAAYGGACASSAGNDYISRFYNNVFINNVATEDGGAMYMTTTYYSPFIFNTVYGNVAGNGDHDGVYITGRGYNGCQPVSNNIFANQDRLALEITGHAGGAVRFNTNIFEARVEGGANDYLVSEPAVNITYPADVKFVDAPGGDLHLRIDSPAVNAGIESLGDCWYGDTTTIYTDERLGFDADMKPRKNGSDVDLGAYEYYAPSSGIHDWTIF